MIIFTYIRYIYIYSQKNAIRLIYDSINPGMRAYHNIALEQHALSSCTRRGFRRCVPLDVPRASERDLAENWKTREKSGTIPDAQAVLRGQQVQRNLDESDWIAGCCIHTAETRTTNSVSPELRGILVLSLYSRLLLIPVCRLRERR